MTDDGNWGRVRLFRSTAMGRFNKHQFLRRRLIEEWRGFEDLPDERIEPPGVGGFIQRVLKEWKLDEKKLGDEIAAAWREAVPEFIARHTAPDTIKRGVLTVRVLHATIHHTLMMEKARLLARLQERFGKDAVRDLKFRHG